MRRLKEKVAVVTRAGSGIGRATARRFVREGASVVIAGSDPDELARLASEFDPNQALAHPADLSDLRSVASLIDAAMARYGRLDVLVNNADFIPDGKSTEPSLDAWRALMAAEMEAVFLCTRAAVPLLISSGGCIVNVSSTPGFAGEAHCGFYDIARGAFGKVTRSLAVELGPKGVRVNAVSSVLAFTAAFENATSEKDRAALAGRSPLGRNVEPAEVADAIAFLASHEARSVTGINLSVDGGLTALNGLPTAA